MPDVKVVYFTLWAVTLRQKKDYVLPLISIIDYHNPGKDDHGVYHAPSVERDAAVDPSFKVEVLPETSDVFEMFSTAAGLWFTSVYIYLFIF